MLNSAAVPAPEDRTANLIRGPRFVPRDIQNCIHPDLFALASNFLTNLPKNFSTNFFRGFYLESTYFCSLLRLIRLILTIANSSSIASLNSDHLIPNDAWNWKSRLLYTPTEIRTDVSSSWYSAVSCEPLPYFILSYVACYASLICTSCAHGRRYFIWKAIHHLPDYRNSNVKRNPPLSVLFVLIHLFLFLNSYSK